MTCGFAGGIPEGDVERSDGDVQHAPRPRPASRTHQTRPGSLHLKDMCPDEVFSQFTSRLRHRPHQIPPIRHDIADTLDAIIRHHARQDVPVPFHLPPCCGIRMFYRDLQNLDLHTGNVHRALLAFVHHGRHSIVRTYGTWVADDAICRLPVRGH